MQSILNHCIDFNSKILKRRATNITQLPKEFAITELRKLIQNNIEAFSTFSEVKRNVFVPEKVNVAFNSKTEETPVIKRPDVIIPPLVETQILPQRGVAAPTGGGGPSSNRREYISVNSNDRVNDAVYTDNIQK